ncbi:type IV leader peptidase family protein [Paraburkholderia sp. BL8N3]|nr:A24 family peptidase [Paraburkholderia sp. BL8N3]TCK31943.1 type IV leader peptidase family protein [Paraburkholderia sp. BL8N3]
MMLLLTLGGAAAIGTSLGCCVPRIARSVTENALRAEGFTCEAATLYRDKSAVIPMAVAVLFAASFARFGWTAKAIFIAVLLFELVLLSLIDFSTLLLPDSVTIPLAISGLGVNAFAVVVPFRDAILGASLAVLFFWTIHWAIYKFSGREGMGFGDVKLSLALGAWLGYSPLLHVMCVALLLAALYGVVLISMRRVRDDRMIPFGPFLSAGAAVTALFGTPLYGLALA